MAVNLGVHVYEQATSVSTPVTADVGVPYVVGLAPVHAAANPAKVNTPVIVTSWSEAVDKLGFSYDWETYTLCEFIYSHFQLFGCQPVIFCNVLDPAKMRTAVEEKEYTVEEHAVKLPFDLIADTLTVKNGTDVLALDEDYSILYDENKNACIVELLGSGSHYGAAALTIGGYQVKTDEIVVADIVEGLGEIDSCMNTVGVIPDLICAPGYSHNSVVAAVMAAKAAGINGLFHAKAIIDCDSGPDGVRQYSDLIGYKNRNNFIDENQILCWPMVQLGDYRFHMSTQLAGLMAQVDTANMGCPYESPSNKRYQMDCCCLADGTEVGLTFEQSCIIAGYGIVTALNFMSMGWTCRNNYTACYPANTDVKDYFIPVSRMFDWVGNTVIRTFWSKLDKPMTRRFADSILDTCNIWLNGLTNMERLLGGRAELLESENNVLDLMAGIIKIHIFMTPPSPAQEIDFILEYDPAYVTAAFS